MTRLADGPDGNPQIAGQSDSDRKGDSTLESLLAEPFRGPRSGPCPLSLPRAIPAAATPKA